jgi:hypothetical protein
MATRMQQRRGTASQWTTANPVLAAGEIGFETDTSKFKIGDGSSAWSTLPYFTNLDAIVAGAPGALDTLNELAAALGDDANFATTVTNSLAAKAGVLSKTDSEWTAYTTDIPVGTVAYNSTNDQVKIGMGDQNWSELSQLITAEALSTAISDLSADILEDTEFSGTVVLPATTSIGDVTGTEIGYLNGVTSSIQDQLNNIESDATYAYNTVTTHETSKADVASPTFSGNVVLPTTTNIGDVSAAEILTLNGVTGSIQTQIDAKLASTVAASTYAPINDPVFTGVADLPATTNIGDVTGTEIGYLDGVTSAIQTQLNAKAPINSPTFTGTVAGITKDMVGLGNVENTSDANKPISDATQTALDLKANLSGATFTGDVEAGNVTITGNLYVQGTTTTVSASDLTIKDNMIYLNQAGLSTITAATGNGTSVTYTTSDDHGYSAGDFVTVTGVTPTSFNVNAGGVEIQSVTATTFTILSSNTDTYVSGGSARGKVHSNPDLGWAAGRYDGSYAHTGFFRDATDGVFKIFDGYVPEPDESVFIDTSHASFALAPIAVESISTGSVDFTDGTQSKQGVPSITPIVQKTASYTLSSLTERDSLIEVSSGSSTTITIPADGTLSFPVGTSIDILQTSTGQVTIAGAGGVTVNSTPGLKLRTQWSSATLFKRAANTWVVYGDLTA